MTTISGSSCCCSGSSDNSRIGLSGWGDLTERLPEYDLRIILLLLRFVR